MMQPVTAKELEYIVDSVSNEDMLLKQCAVAATSATNQAIKQTCSQMIQMHQQHIQTLIQSIQQHQYMAPSQPQN
ncbi:hypothetical protein [Paenibacillus spongiae]|uniref:Spore coat protein n=1 Tax=Paenibacillus spongiae TaxID=2909671 RepID=A0ABY5SMG7_9BACL|nr:hypothetical protein [Paenibacillus spongiae]UVI33753.1 hypothetical protein L1F29_25160 [Paenibacillus spongiae]